MSAAELRYPAERSFALVYSITAGTTQNAVVLRQRLPTWREKHVFGSPLALGIPRLAGPGRLTGAYQDTHYVFGVCSRGSGETSQRWLRIELSPGAHTTLVQPVRLTRAPWPVASYRVRTDMSIPGHAGRTPLRMPAVNVRGPFGVHIRLRTRPDLRQGRFGPDGPFVAPSSPIAITGTTAPRVADAPIRLIEYRQADDGDLTAARKRLATVRTDRRGHLRARIPGPKQDGTYLVEARYRSAANSPALSDSNCDLHFTVRK
jgi:hypothetical protein